MVGVDGSSPFAPTKFGREVKHLAETSGAFFFVNQGLDAVIAAYPLASTDSLVKPVHHFTGHHAQCQCHGTVHRAVTVYNRHTVCGGKGTLTG